MESVPLLPRRRRRVRTSLPLSQTVSTTMWLTAATNATILATAASASWTGRMRWTVSATVNKHPKLSLPRAAKLLFCTLFYSGLLHFCADFRLSNDSLIVSQRMQMTDFQSFKIGQLMRLYLFFSVRPQLSVLDTILLEQRCPADTPSLLSPSLTGASGSWTM